MLLRMAISASRVGVSAKGAQGMELLQSDLKLRQLKVFREVLRAGSTRRAAVALGISQPAVSQHVKQLETISASHCSSDQPTASSPCRKPGNSCET
ncbi:LysR family transcriptional regulator [Mesorhizobium sp. M1252]|uniref:LysR family transcriptional regulator n=1 Tax=Mesorhizobium sp. M1252 TaxID=2957073 RepID=UPI00333C6886